VTLPRERLLVAQVQLRQRAQQAPPADWLPVVIGGCELGFASAATARFLAQPSSFPGRQESSDFHLPEDSGFPSARERLAREAEGSPYFAIDAGRLVLDDAHLDPEARTALLLNAACRLRDAGLLRGWRGEMLDLRATPDVPPLARIERAACRPLGVTTTAVHLNAFTPAGEIVVARRAAHKQIDPGLWDNLVGGMVPAGESELDALGREAQEEAGLDLAGWPLARGGRIQVTRVVPEGYQSEIVQIFDAVLPPATQPHNQDGEVECFAVLDTARALAAIERGEFTLEAALAILDALLRRK
jgi:8-oxo-dGTP pyrophosphatase MutT (NUDIX family)